VRGVVESDDTGHGHLPLRQHPPGFHDTYPKQVVSKRHGESGAESAAEIKARQAAGFSGKAPGTLACSGCASRGGEARPPRLASALRFSDSSSTGTGFTQAAQAHYDEAIKCFLKEADPPHAYNLGGEIAMKNSNYAAAQKFFTSAISASPRYFEAAQKNLALVNERLTESAAADRRVAQSAIAVAPT
jgi:tetratricopeptide (TPR) repeat protein